MSGAIALGGRRRRPAIDGLPTFAAVFTVAGALALITIVLGWRGSDLPAQVFRAELVRENGFVIWNSQWFGGHATLGYSVLAPPISAITGVLTVGAISGVVAAVLFERVLRFTFGPATWIGAMWFAVGTVVNLMVGRTTWALGIALGIAAVYALQRRHPVAAAAAAVLCSLSSPLAGLFLAIVAAAWAAGEREHRLGRLGVLAGALAPIAVTAVLFPSSGIEPYDRWAVIWDVVLCAVVAVACWRYRAARWAAALVAVAAISVYLVPTPIGGNISRLGQYVAGPVLACVLFRRRLILGALAIPLLIWQFYPAIDTVAFARTDPSTKESYYEPLLDFLADEPGPVGRVEIPFTFRHWEAAYAAPHIMLARGWERQLDMAYNEIFYEDGPLAAGAYRSWLHDNGVKFVALPDTQLDHSSHDERDLLVGGLPYLHEVYRSPHWRVWRVDGFDGLVDGPASLVELAPDRIVVDVLAAGDVDLRVRATRHWSVNGDAGGCATSTDDGWTRLRNLPVGRIVVTPSIGGTPCPN